MSTKSTILLSDKNEHWYHDCSDDSIILELDIRDPDRVDYWFSNDGEDLCIKIEKGSHLWEEIMKLNHWYKRKGE